jgi:hypothetical protein
VNTSEGIGNERHFAGVTTSFVVEYLRSQMSAAEVDAVLQRAGETRTVEQLADDSTWSSYTQLRRFLEAAVEALGNDSAGLRNVGSETVALLPDFTTMLMGLGTPGAL